MDFTTYVRKPFTVEAVQITSENLEEIAKQVGKLKKDGDLPYIEVNPNLVPNITKVYPGYWFTKMNNKVRCYSSHIFEAQFMEITPDKKELIDKLNDNALESKTP